MCGIAGIISYQAEETLYRELKSMTDQLAHRGPNGEGYWRNQTAHVHFGHRRLSIIDLSEAGAQPMHYLNRFTIIYNGEIYNYKEIKADLLRKGCQFRSVSDTEVVLAAYACYKEQCLSLFDGMFAFAIWDEKEQTLFAARDRFGEKPFFYSLQQDRLVFGSEIKALRAGGVEKKINRRMLYNFLTLGYTVNPGDASETFFLDVQKLPAASFLLFHLPARKLSVQRYWKPDAEIKQPRHEEEAIEQFRDLLQTSVQRRLRSDVPVGTSLSGGLDSSTIVAIMKQWMGGVQEGAHIKTFSAVFPGYEKDESRFVRSVQQKLEIENYQTEPAAHDFIENFDLLCHHQDEPFISSSIYAQFAVFALAAKQKVTVLLDGQGADETLAGYDKYYHWYWQELYRTDRGKFRWELEQARKTGIAQPWGWHNRMAALLPGLSQSVQRTRQKRLQRKTNGLTPEFVSAYGESYYTLPRTDRLGNVLHYNTFINGLEDLLRYADRNSMAHGREVRLPFLQHELVEFIFSLPAGFKIRDGRTKWILRKTMEEKLPAEIVWRTDKVGFEPPQQLWMQHPGFQAYVTEQKQRLVRAGVLKKSVLHKTVKPQESRAALNLDWRFLVAGKLLT